MEHGHPPAGDPPEITVYADSLLRGGTPLARVVNQGREKDRSWATFSASNPLTKAELVYTKVKGDWMVREWLADPVALTRSVDRVEATIPSGTTAYYFNLTDTRGCIVSTEHEELK